MRYADLIETDGGAAIHALTHEILMSHGLEHEPFRSPLSPTSGALFQSKYMSDAKLGTGYHDHLKDAGWKKVRSYTTRETDDPDEGDLPAGTWADTHETEWEHPDSPWNLHTTDSDYHPDLENNLSDMSKHYVYYTGKSVLKRAV